MAWDQPRTIKLYLHPPLCRRQITLWPDLKLVSKMVGPAKGVAPDDHGIRFLCGEGAEPVNWLASEWNVRDDGLPLPELHARWGAFDLTLEAFCEHASQPTTWLRLRVTNRSLVPQPFELGLMGRTGLDGLLIGMRGDYYASYRPELGHWAMIPNTWHMENGGLTDGDHRLAVAPPEGATLEWIERNPTNIHARSYARSRCEVEGHRTVHWLLTLGSKPKVTPTERAWGQARDRALAAWRQDLCELALRPDTDDIEIQRVFASLVVQSLQMLAVDGDGRTRPRQGARCDGVWPVEAIEWLQALDRIGLEAWAERGYGFFRDRQIGPDDPSGDAGRFIGIEAPHWTSETGGLLVGLGYHLIRARDQALFQSWREPLLRAVAWIQAQRAQTDSKVDPLGRGLFPAGIGHDWQWEGQYWCFTDGWSYMGLCQAAAALEAYEDPAASEVRRAANAYGQALRDTLQLLYAGHEEDDLFYVPNVLGVPERYPPYGPYHGDGPIALIRAGIIPAESRLFEQVEAYFRHQGWMRNGLTALMTDSLLTQGYFADPWAGHTWYTSFSDYPWFMAWLERGERDKATQTLQAQLRYAMSSEYYMLERYADNDDTFCPWQPNASANGRTIMMLLEYFGEAPA